MPLPPVTMLGAASSSGEDVRFALDQIRRLAGAASADLAEIEISPSGYGLHFPRLNADVWLPALRVQEQR